LKYKIIMVWGTPFHNNKIYFKVKMDVENGSPYWVWHRFFQNTIRTEEIRDILKDYIKDDRDIMEAMERFKAYIIPVDSQIRFSGNPCFFTQLWDKKFHDEFRRICEKISKSTVDVKQKDGTIKKWPLAFFTMYQYRNK